MSNSHPRAGSAHGGRPPLRSAPLPPPKRSGANGRPPKVAPRPGRLRASPRTPKNEGFPSLAPPVPLAERLSGGARRREILSEVWWQTPCWLASLVIHLALLVVVASIVVTYGERTPDISVILAMDAGAHEVAVRIETLTIVDSEESVEQEDVAEKTAEAEQGERKRGEEDKPPPTASSASAAGAESGLRDPFTVLKSLAFRREATEPPTRQAQDRIVDRFILYDIGKLKGEEGQKARRDFDRLGPRAIPSLVYGLNRAANLHANCPICVLSRKLERALAESDDPAMLRYAIENIGRDVPISAPYARRVAEIKRKLAESEKAQALLVRAELASMGIDPDRSNLAREARELARAKTGDLAKALRDDDPDRRLAAAIVANVWPLPPEQPRAPLVKPLVKLLNDPDPRVRGQAHDALVTITHEDFGPAYPNASQQDREAAMEKWLAHWYDKVGLREFEPQAAAALARAKTLQDHGRAEAAAKHYRKLITDFPDSRAAEEARSRLPLAGLARQPGR